MLEKIEQLKKIFKNIDPNVELGVEKQSDDSYVVVGPFPSFMIMLDDTEVCRALIHVNADAANMVYIFSEFEKELDICFDGSFAIDAEKGELLFNADAYAKKEENILMFANEIISRRREAKKVEVYVPEVKKIILA